MRQFFIVLIGLLCFVEMQAQIGSTGNNGNSIPDDDWICHVEQEGQFSPEMTDNSTFGNSFTPKGDIRVLVVFVEYTNNDSDPNEFENQNWWPQGGLPNVIDPNTNKLKFGYESINEFDLLGNPNVNANNNLSEFFYQMSGGQLRVLFETYKDSNGNPKIITVDPSDLCGVTDMNINNVTKLAFDEIAQLYPTKNYAQEGFDIRPTKPDFTYDASANFAQPNSNNVIDYTMVIHRNSSLFNDEYCTSPIEPQASGQASIPSSYALGNNYLTGPGHTMIRYTGYYPRFIEVTLHEMMHTVINMPHVGLANGSHGKYFYSAYSPGIMQYGISNSIASPWERWYLGWEEITHDLINGGDNGVYTLNDFMETGESIRLKLPNLEGQSVWLYYKDVNKSNSFYERTIPQAGLGFPDSPDSGLFATVERIARNRVGDAILSPLSISKNNGYKTIFGGGNYDFDIASISPGAEFGSWINLNNKKENPYSAHHPSVGFRFDGNESGLISHSSNGNGGGNEFFTITKINGEEKTPKILLNSSLPNKKYSIFSNPSITNLQEVSLSSIDPPNKLSPIILHSLSFISRESNGTMQIEVDYDDGHIEEDFRMTGNVYLPQNEDIFLDKDITLTINRSGTPNLRDDLFNVSNPTIDQFISPTAFIAAGDSSFSLGKEGVMIIDEGSTVIFEEDSQLNFEQGANIIVRGGSLLCIKTDDINFANFTSRIIVEDGYLNVAAGINISANVTIADNNFSFPLINNTINYCSVQSPDHFHSILETNMGDPVCPFDITIGTDEFVKHTSQDHIDIGPGFEVDGGYFDASIQYIIPQDCDLEFFFGDLGVPGTLWDGPNDGSIDKDNIEGMAIKVFPNPSRDIFNVSIENDRGSFSYSIRDFKGLEVDARTVVNNSFNFDLSSQPRGIYFLTVQQGDKIETVELIKL